MRILAYVIHRLLILLLAVLGVSVITFIVTRVLPGNPAYLIVGVQADQSTVDAIIDKMGLDKPILEQYWLYMQQLSFCCAQFHFLASPHPHMELHYFLVPIGSIQRQ